MNFWKALAKLKPDGFCDSDSPQIEDAVRILTFAIFFALALALTMVGLAILYYARTD